MKARTPIKKISAKRLAAAGNKIPFSSISPSGKGVKRVNTKAKAKRKIGYRKMLASPEYKAARTEAMERSGNRCEYVEPANSVHDAFRCCMGFTLHAHHLRYPKSRPLEARDLKILCKWHHEKAEGEKLHKTRMF